MIEGGFDRSRGSFSAKRRSFLIFFERESAGDKKHEEFLLFGTFSLLAQVKREKHCIGVNTRANH